MTDHAPVRSLVGYVIGGGWGSEEPDDTNNEAVAIIRGADFPKVAVGETSTLPVRYESVQRVKKRRLDPGDIVLEVSGGTNDRPTGRSVFITETLLTQLGIPCIPASFCRLLRPNDTLVEPRYLYYWLQNMYRAGRTWAYQVRSTGIANFQTEYFLDAEIVRLPPLDEQRRIAAILGALDDLIEVNRGLISECAELISARYKAMMETSPQDMVPLFDVFEIDFGAAFKGADFTSPGEGLPLLRIRDLKTFLPDTWTSERRTGDVLVSPGDVVVGMDAEFRPTFWLGDPALLNQRVCRVRPKKGSTAFVRESLVKPLAFIEGHKTGTTVSHLNKADLAETKIAVPSGADLAEFDSFAEPLREALVGLYRENMDLATTRDELLPLLMSGRVRVGDVAA